MSTLALIGLGSNLGDRKAHLAAALAALAETPGVAVRAVSSYHETAPVGGPGGQGAFLNAAARLETTLDPFALLKALRAIEQRAGRSRAIRWDARTLDLDLLVQGSTVLESPGLSLPHPRLAVRRFVLAPLSEIAPTIVDPMTGRTFAQLLANLDRRPSYVALDGLSGDLRTTIFDRLVGRLSAVGLPARELGPAVAETTAWSFDALQTRSDSLAASHWPADRLADRWLVSDFCLGLEWARSIALPDASQTATPEGFAVFHARRRALESAVNGSLPPTFAVHLGAEDARGPRRAAFPVLGIKAEDPLTMIEEIIAACAATRTG